MVKQATEKYEHGKFTCQRVDEVPPRGDDRKTIVHEAGDTASLFRETHEALKSGARSLLAEPRGHVSQQTFDASLNLAWQSAFSEIDRPRNDRRYVVLLEKLAG
jgi:hypothetical protein